MTQKMNPVVAEVTARIVERSRADRQAYLQRLDAAAERGTARGRLACANLAHGFAARIKSLSAAAGDEAGDGRCLGHADQSQQRGGSPQLAGQ